MATVGTAPSCWLSVSSASSRPHSAASASPFCSSSVSCCGISHFSVSRDARTRLERDRRQTYVLDVLRRAGRVTRSRVVRSSIDVEVERPNFSSNVENIEHLLVTSRDGEIRWKETVSAAVLAAATFLQVGDFALAGQFGPRFRDLPDFRTDSEGWAVVGITSLVAGVAYLFVIPLILYYYLNKRWYKRNLPETIFQFLLVFLFFPGLLLLAPFINLRPLPKNGAKSP